MSKKFYLLVSDGLLVVELEVDVDDVDDTRELECEHEAASAIARSNRSSSGKRFAHKPTLG